MGRQAPRPLRLSRPPSSRGHRRGSDRRAGSIGRPSLTRAWIASLTSQTLTFIPARTRPLPSQKADELAPVHVTAEHDLVVAAGLDVARVLHAQVVLVGV